MSMARSLETWFAGLLVRISERTARPQPQASARRAADAAVAYLYRERVA